jgi:hypothetical protein
MQEEKVAPKKIPLGVSVRNSFSEEELATNADAVYLRVKRSIAECAAIERTEAYYVVALLSYRGFFSNALHPLKRLFSALDYIVWAQCRADRFNIESTEIDELKKLILDEILSSLKMFLSLSNEEQASAAIIVQKIAEVLLHAITTFENFKDMSQYARKLEQAIVDDELALAKRIIMELKKTIVGREREVIFRILNADVSLFSLNQQARPVYIFRDTTETSSSQVTPEENSIVSGDELSLKEGSTFSPL